MDDLTLIYVTASEIPKRWVEYQVKCLLAASGNTPIISMSRKPMNLGDNYIDTDKKSYWNIYAQLLRGAIKAKTPYVAMIEDDTLYSKEHFTEFRPKSDEVSYNRSRWSLFSWDTIYCLRQRISNCSLIASREYLIDALQERQDKWPDGLPNKLTGEVGRRLVEKNMQVSYRKKVEWYSTTPIIQLNHDSGSDDFAKRHHKKHGQIKAHDIPFWGRSNIIGGIYESTRSS